MLIWTDSARCDLYDIQLHLVDQDARTALRLGVKIARKAEILTSQPSLGRQGIVEGTREWPIPGLPYTLVYQLREDVVEKLRVVHQARNWP